MGTLCQHAQPRGTGKVGDAVLGATGACASGYQHKQGWADPDNPRGKSSGQCLFTRYALCGDRLCLCLSCNPMSPQCPHTGVPARCL